MSIYITIDGGTTNTRINLIKSGTIIDSIKLNIGAKSSIENKDSYKNEIKTAIERVLKNNHLCEEEISQIIASGMITSEFGLCNLEHIDVPAGISELHSNVIKNQRAVKPAGFLAVVMPWGKQSRHSEN